MRAFVHPKEALPALLSRMQRWPVGNTVWPGRVREWLRANASFRKYVLTELERNGPMLSRQFEGPVAIERPVQALARFLNARDVQWR